MKNPISRFGLRFGSVFTRTRFLGAIALALLLQACGPASETKPEPDTPPPQDVPTPLIQPSDPVSDEELSVCDHESSDVESDLIVALERENLACVESALDRGASVETGIRYFERPLHLAVRKGNLQLAEFLLERGADIEAPSQTYLTSRNVSRGVTPLTLAVALKSFEMASLLFDHGADPAKPDEDGLTALWWAVSGNDLDLTRLCLKRNFKEQINNRFDQTRLGHRAVQNGNLEMLGLLEEHGFDMESRDGWGRTLLHEAASYGEVEIARTVLKNSPYLLNVRGGRLSNTALHQAVLSWKSGMIRFLLEAGANPYVEDHFGTSAVEDAHGSFGGSHIFEEYGHRCQPKEKDQ